MTYFHKSTQATTALKTMCAALPDVIYSTLEQDVDTRWWATIDLVSSVNKVKAALRAIAAAGSLPPSALITDEHWALLAVLEMALDPVREIQRFMESQKFVSVSLIIPTIHNLREHFHAFRAQAQLAIAAANGAEPADGAAALLAEAAEEAGEPAMTLANAEALLKVMNIMVTALNVRYALHTAMCTAMSFFTTLHDKRSSQA